VTEVNDTAIEIKDMCKRFKLRRSGTRTLKTAALDVLKGKSSTTDLWAMKDVSFSVSRGEVLGIIGANGAGKSTLLALICGTMAPTSGSVTTRGKISALLELGAGFHPDLSGRENIFLYGAIMGLKRREVAAKFDKIVEFAELEKYIDQPVKHYSSGMYVRLGFAVAVEVDPEILLIDEVLAVGDEVFQRKCIKKINEFKERGKTMLIISHDLTTIRSISDRIVVLDKGQVVSIGRPDSMVQGYRARSMEKTTGDIGREWGSGGIRITDVEFSDAGGNKTDTFQWGSSLTATLKYDAAERIEEPVFGFSLSDDGGRVIYGNNTQMEGLEIPVVEGPGAVKLHLDNLPVSSGTYLFSFAIHSADHKVNYHRLDNQFSIAVEAEKACEGCCYIEGHWSAGSGGE
jgi:ABC-type polysaccharide/polyol phosphate transport system ATPase subunit